MDAIRDQIKKLRVEHGMTQQALAERLNVTRQAVSQWENGNTEPDLDTLAAIAAAFGLDITDVISGNKTSKTSSPLRRKRYLARFIVFAALTLAGFITLALLEPSDWLTISPNGDFQISRYAVFYNGDLLFYTEPLLYMLLSLSALFGASLFWDIRINRKSLRRAVLAFAIAFALLYYIAGIIYHGGDLPMFIFNLITFADCNPAIFILVGIGLFLGCNVPQINTAASSAQS